MGSKPRRRGTSQDHVVEDIASPFPPAWLHFPSPSRQEPFMSAVHVQLSKPPSNPSVLGPCLSLESSLTPLHKPCSAWAAPVYSQRTLKIWVPESCPLGLEGGASGYILLELFFVCRSHISIANICICFKNSNCLFLVLGIEFQALAQAGQALYHWPIPQPKFQTLKRNYLMKKLMSFPPSCLYSHYHQTWYSFQKFFVYMGSYVNSDPFYYTIGSIPLPAALYLAFSTTVCLHCSLFSVGTSRSVTFFFHKRVPFHWWWTTAYLSVPLLWDL